MTPEQQIESLIDEIEQLRFQLKASDSDNEAKDKEIAELKQQLKEIDELIEKANNILKQEMNPRLGYLKLFSLLINPTNKK